ncbi:unnamed protein product, partial [Prorocentrum cordatum]
RQAAGGKTGKKQKAQQQTFSQEHAAIFKDVGFMTLDEARSCKDWKEPPATEQAALRTPFKAALIARAKRLLDVVQANRRAQKESALEEQELSMLKTALLMLKPKGVQLPELTKLRFDMNTELNTIHAQQKQLHQRAMLLEVRIAKVYDQEQELMAQDLEPGYTSEEEEGPDEQPVQDCAQPSPTPKGWTTGAPWRTSAAGAAAPADPGPGAAPRAGHTPRGLPRQLLTVKKEHTSQSAPSQQVETAKAEGNRPELFNQEVAQAIRQLHQRMDSIQSQCQQQRAAPPAPPQAVEAQQLAMAARMQQECQAMELRMQQELQEQNWGVKRMQQELEERERMLATQQKEFIQAETTQRTRLEAQQMAISQVTQQHQAQDFRLENAMRVRLEEAMQLEEYNEQALRQRAELQEQCRFLAERSSQLQAQSDSAATHLDARQQAAAELDEANGRILVQQQKRAWEEQRKYEEMEIQARQRFQQAMEQLEVETSAARQAMARSTQEAAERAALEQAQAAELAQQKHSSQHREAAMAIQQESDRLRMEQRILSEAVAEQLHIRARVLNDDLLLEEETIAQQFQREELALQQEELQAASAMIHRSRDEANGTDTPPAEQPSDAGQCYIDWQQVQAHWGAVAAHAQVPPGQGSTGESHDSHSPAQHSDQGSSSGGPVVLSPTQPVDPRWWLPGTPEADGEGAAAARQGKQDQDPTLESSGRRDAALAASAPPGVEASLQGRQQQQGDLGKPVSGASNSPAQSKDITASAGSSSAGLSDATLRDNLLDLTATTRQQHVKQRLLQHGARGKLFQTREKGLEDLRRAKEAK